MPDLSDPNKVHELLVILLLCILFPTFLVLAGYVRALGGFFQELKVNEHAVWERIGSPSLPDMLLLPFFRFRKYFAFLPVLRERAGTEGYRHAAAAYLLLRLGLVLCTALFVMTGVVILWVVRHGL